MSSTEAGQFKSGVRESMESCLADDHKLGPAVTVEALRRQLVQQNALPTLRLPLTNVDIFKCHFIHYNLSLAHHMPVSCACLCILNLTIAFDPVTIRKQT